MKKQTSLFFAAVFMMVLSFNAFSQKTVDFSYRYPVKPVVYVSTLNIHEVLDIQGQSMDVYVSNVLGCKIKAAGNHGSNMNLEVTIDSLAEIVDSPQGFMGGNINEVRGKTFSIAITSTGKIADISGAKNTTYTIPGQGSGNLSGSFADFFPVLPAGKVSAGYTWTSVDTVSSEAGMTSQVTIMTSENKFEGFEKVGGMNCAKITSITTGTSNMKNEMQGMSMITSGDFTGTGVTWFSPEAGYFVKSTSTVKMTGNIEMPNEGYSFPVVMDIVETKDVKK